MSFRSFHRVALWGNGEERATRLFGCVKATSVVFEQRGWGGEDGDLFAPLFSASNRSQTTPSAPSQTLLLPRIERAKFLCRSRTVAGANRRIENTGEQERNVASAGETFRPPLSLSQKSKQNKNQLLTCEEFPAVVVPSFLKTVRSCPRDCTVTPGRIPSSSDTTMAFSSSVLGSIIFVLTGTISSRKRPEA